VWAAVFDIELSDRDAEFEVLHRLYETYGLVDKLVEEIGRIEDPDERDEFMVPIDRLRNAILIAQASNSGPDAIRQISDSDFIVLKFCSRYLHNHSPEPVADATELEDLSAHLTDLFNLVEASSTLDAELKKFLLPQIEAIRRGVQEYRIGGIERLREALGSVYGATFVNSEPIEHGKDTDEVKRFGEVLNQLAAIVTFAWKTTKVLEAAQTIFPMLLK